MGEEIKMCLSGKQAQLSIDHIYSAQLSNPQKAFLQAEVNQKSSYKLSFDYSHI